MDSMPVRCTCQFQRKGGGIEESNSKSQKETGTAGTSDDYMKEERVKKRDGKRDRMSMREKQKREEVKVLPSPEETRMLKRVELFDCLMLNLQPEIPDIL